MTCEFFVDASFLSLLSIYPKIKVLILDLLWVTRWKVLIEAVDSVIAVYYDKHTPAFDSQQS